MKTLDRGITVAVALLVVGFGVTRGLAAETASYSNLLLRMGITPDATGITKYLEELHPTPHQQARIAKLIRELNSEEFTVREAATRKLEQLPNQPTEALQETADGDDPEAAWRARRLLKLNSQRSAQILLSVFQTVDRLKIQGTAPAILKAIPLCTKQHMHYAARKALIAASSTADLGVLRDAVKSENFNMRRAAAAALGATLGAECAKDMVPLLRDPHGWIRFEAARALGNIGDRNSLQALGRLLTSDELVLRVESASLLRNLTRETIVFVAYDKLEVRNQQAAKWLEWIAQNGSAAKLHFPIKRGGGLFIGHTLISLYQQHRVVELDAEGNEILEIKGLRGPWGAIRLANGNLLVNWFSSHCVVEYDPAGKEVWKWNKADVQYPWSAQRLNNGDTLMACNEAVLQVSRMGSVVWQARQVGHVSHAIRLENGRTLISLMTDGKVLELDRNGKVVWQIPDLKQPYRLQRLENGNTLVTEKGRNQVVEYDRTGKNIVWSKTGLNSPDSAQRLANGNTLISDGRAIFEVDPTGKIVWEKPYVKSIVRRY